ncbi:PadR family transcriptional regulator [Streptomyces sp. MB09-02B]|uniref:PadR family transcriptional regulator n=1 Tax=Streptomyces sp. MB09-02B TaxID=3028667 RepID=UPI0029A0C579|nr:PadR family transcriptional regulator [Streptomyces sp. MB09-02B]MDX3640380.1 PadR family transcriptional regulator [Streptomyces sp. MB09-02B]
MSTPHVLLGLLASRPGHGYDLKKRHDARFPKARPLAYGQVYTTLQRLLRDGLAEAVSAEAAGARERLCYRITAEGSIRLRGWLSEVVPAVPFVTHEIFAKVVVAVLAGPSGSAADYLDAQRAAHRARIAELNAARIAVGISLADVLSMDYAVAHLDADLCWMDAAAGHLSGLENEMRGS